MKRRVIFAVALCIIAMVSGVYGLRRQQEAAAKPDSVSKERTTPQSTRTPSIPVAFDTSRYSLFDPASIWVIANKQRPLIPSTYTPSDLVVPNIRLRSNITAEERQVRQVTAEALQNMAAAAADVGVTLTLQSGYRSFSFQTNLYNHYVAVQGKAVADTQSARPSYSEHQTGLSADIGGITRPACNVENCFKDTPEGQWLAANASTYGFIIRYPSGKDAVTGYVYEPWHVRYVGLELARELTVQNTQTLEEFFELPAAADYN